MQVVKETLKSYLNSNSTTITRSRAKDHSPLLIDDKPTRAEFKCKGSTGNNYLIVIEAFNTGMVIRTSCTCPYNFSGVCKHTISCLSYLINDRNTYQSKYVDKNIIKLSNGILEMEVFKEIPFFETRYYRPEAEVKKIDRQSISFEVIDGKKHQVSFSFNKTADTLTVACNCYDDHPFCLHTSRAFAEFLELFGPAYFTSDFEEHVLTDYLKLNGYRNNAKSRALFKVLVSKSGVNIDPKFKNIQPLGKIESIKLFKTKNTKTKALLIAPPQKAENEIGLGFCLQYLQKELIGISPFVGKWNKARTHLATKYEMLDANNVGENLMHLKGTVEKELVFECIEMTEKISGMQGFYRADPDMKKAYSLLTRLAPQIREYYICDYSLKYNFVKKNTSEVFLSNEKAKLEYELTENEDFYTLKARVVVGDKVYYLDDKFVTASDLIFRVGNTIHAYHNFEHQLGIERVIEDPEFNYFKEDKNDLWSKVIEPLSESFEIHTDIKSPKKIAPENVDGKKQVYVADYEGVGVTFTLTVSYDGVLTELGGYQLLTKVVEGQEMYVERDLELENEFLEYFKSLHPNFDHDERVYVLPAEELIANNWFIETTESLKQKGVEIYGIDKLKSFTYNLNKAVVSTSVKSDIDWFDVKIEVAFGKQVASLKELQKSFVTKSKYVKLDDGTLGILPDKWMNKFKNFFVAGDVRKDGIRVSNYSFGIIDELYSELEVKPKFLEELYLRKQRLFNLSDITTVAKPRGLTATLRDYQCEGLNWMAFLDENKLGGCLADDMGLGKTLQTIAFLKHIKDKNKPNKPTLIVAPTSLIFNWNQEIQKFCKSLKILTYTGVDRAALRTKFAKTDLIISTYGTVINDIEILQKEKFHYVILDESQAIKNPNSKRYKSVRLLQAHNRMVLTGTPIENNTFDLYAQLNFLNPGLLGSMAHFKRVFATGIDKHQDDEIAALLHKIITPFVLRRTKEQVATELPEKTENVIYCEMGSEQKKVYDFYKKKYRDYLTEKIDENGEKKAQMYILEGLTKLRQVCNSPALVSTETEDYGNNAIKLDILTNHILEKTGEHKILVFSQFVSMLSLIKERLASYGVKYEYLDGATRDRQKCVENFQNNKDIRVFLISLKAGGTGLNLTEADYVYIVDPWWNPAVENQAIDRCYRIGQKNRVMAYRMICKDTIEEKIVKLQSKKKSVASSIIKMDEGSKSFNLEEVKDLFG